MYCVDKVYTVFCTADAVVVSFSVRIELYCARRSEWVRVSDNLLRRKQSDIFRKQSPSWLSSVVHNRMFSEQRKTNEWLLCSVCRMLPNESQIQCMTHWHKQLINIMAKLNFIWSIRMARAPYLTRSLTHATMLHELRISRLFANLYDGISKPNAVTLSILSKCNWLLMIIYRKSKFRSSTKQSRTIVQRNWEMCFYFAVKLLHGMKERLVCAAMIEEKLCVN